jgi:hypothetical protein
MNLVSQQLVFCVIDEHALGSSLHVTYVKSQQMTFNRKCLLVDLPLIEFHFNNVIGAHSIT